MPSGVWKITDIPADKVDMVVADFQLESPDTVEKTEQPNGKWTVVATYPGEGEDEKVFNG